MVSFFEIFILCMQAILISVYIGLLVVTVATYRKLTAFLLKQQQNEKEFKQQQNSDSSRIHSESNNKSNSSPQLIQRYDVQDPEYATIQEERLEVRQNVSYEILQ